MDYVVLVALLTAVGFVAQVVLTTLMASVVVQVKSIVVVSAAEVSALEIAAHMRQLNSAWRSAGHHFVQSYQIVPHLKMVLRSVVSVKTDVVYLRKLFLSCSRMIGLLICRL